MPRGRFFNFIFIFLTHFVPSIGNTLAKNKLYLKTMWAMDNSFRRYIQTAGKVAKSNTKKKEHVHCLRISQVCYSFTRDSEFLIIHISFIAFGFHTKINYPKSKGGLDPWDTKCGTLNVWLIQDSGTGVSSGCTSPPPWLLAPQQPPAGKRRWLQDQWVLVDAFTKHLDRRHVCRGRVLHQGWSFSRGVL